MITGNIEPINNNSISTLPNMADVIDSWVTQYTALIITKKTINFIEVETIEEIQFSGMITRMNTKELQLKEEGQRNWSWYHLYNTEFQFKNDDIIIVKGNRYRIMSTDCDDTYYGFWHYDLLEDYKEVSHGNITNNM